MAESSPLEAPPALRVVAPAERPALTVGVLGGLDLHLWGAAVPVSAAKQQTVLAALALSAGDVVSTDALVDELWAGRPPKSAVNTLQTYVSRLRRLLQSADCPDSPLRTHARGYELAVDGSAVDALQFEWLLGRAREARRSDPAVGCDLLAQALQLWRGPPLAGLTLGPVLRPQVERLEELRQTATRERLELELELGRHAEVVGELTAIVAAQPLVERNTELLMTALYRSGRQAEALGAYRALRATLVAELGVEPGPKARDLHEAVLDHDPVIDLGEGITPPGATKSPHGHIPRPLTALIGRDGDVVEVCELVGTNRLVTLTGPGGCGKTRLAIAAATQLEPQFAPAAWFVDLASLDEPELVPKAVLTALGLNERADRPAIDDLVERLRPHRGLLVLDNCEHLVAAVAQLADGLLRMCPELRVLATSQEALQLSGEATVAVRPLPVPTTDGASAAEVAESAAARLFTERVVEASTGFALTEANASAVARICRSLDGIPLALELAAARLGVIGAEEVADRLDDRFGLLVTGIRTGLPRHRTLRATVDWSYDLLGPGEQALFVSLSVFAGSFSLAAAEAVCAPSARKDAPATVLDSLGQLVAKSLVVVQPGPDGARYRLLETLREYGRERLAAASEHDTRRLQHAAWCLDEVRGSQAGLRGAGHDVWRQRLDVEQDNLRAALRWTLEAADEATALALTGSLWWFWYRTGQPREGYLWTRRALALVDRAGPVVVRQRVVVLTRAAQLAWALDDIDTADAYAAEALAFFTREDDDYGMAEATAVLGMTALQRGKITAAVELFSASLAAHRSAGDAWSIATAAVLLGRLWLELGETAKASALIEESLTGFIGTGDPFGIGWARWSAGKLAASQGDHEVAIDHFAVGLTLSRDIGHLIGVGLAVIGLAQAAVSTGRPLVAAQLFAAAMTLAAAIGVPLHIHYGSGYEQALADTRDQLGPTRYSRAWAQGETMSTAQMTAHALAVADEARP